MVVQGVGEGRQGFSEALKGHSLVEQAAYVALLGHDPMEWLASTGDELQIRTAVLAKALELDGKRRLDQLKFLSEQFKAVREQIANIRF